MKITRGAWAMVVSGVVVSGVCGAAAAADQVTPSVAPKADVQVISVGKAQPDAAVTGPATLHLFHPPQTDAIDDQDLGRHDKLALRRDLQLVGETAVDAAALAATAHNDPDDTVPEPTDAVNDWTSDLGAPAELAPGPPGGGGSAGGLDALAGPDLH